MKPSIRDDFDKFQDENCYLPKRIIYFGSDIMSSEFDYEAGVDYASAAKIIKNLIYLDSISNDPILIYFNSPGGDWHHGMAIYDVIRGLKSYVTMIGFGYVRSMGTIIMQACDERILSANCGFMIHDGYEGFDGIPKSFESWGEESKYTRRLMYKIYYNKIKEKHPKKYTLKDIEDWCAHDTIFHAEQAVSLGLADKVLGTKF